MKKLITILTMMIVLVCFVYADIQTSLDLHIMLTAQVPSFRLSITSDTDVTSAASLDSGSGASPSSALSSGSLETLLSSSGQVAVSFDLSQITNARLTGSHASTYTLSVEATDLILQNNGADVASPDGFQKFTVADNGIPTITIASDTLITTSNSVDFTVAEISATDNELTVHYIGFVAASSNNPRSLGSFSVSWNANEDAIPGEYKAAIKLNISTV